MCNIFSFQLSNVCIFSFSQDYIIAHFVFWVCLTVGCIRMQFKDAIKNSLKNSHCFTLFFHKTITD